MYLEIFQADFAVLRVFLGISRDFAEIPKIRGSATARNIRSPVYSCQKFLYELQNKILCRLLFIGFNYTDKEKE